ncbi:hypothetical protein CALVIDRAFT_389827 [Calocera viscosa TUFC12733]|uniref:Citrate transporter-like domain-containing protein n=1 Tax=Calocera viscosa (strain TUFC12733) TaxID=1330018 RepID=A0A167GHV6_CALVF|nr:hypothetical protein CALVIDRAFT_389827 [Calocera viscosa TUFC12733]
MATMDRPIDGRSIFTLIVFLATNIIVIAPFSISIPLYIWNGVRKTAVSLRVLEPTIRLHRSPRFRFDFSTVPVIAVLLLLATTCIGGEEVYKGIVGSNGIKPYDIMCLFISLAYISISLDATGLLRFLAFWVAKRGGASGRRLYFLLYFFFLAYGLIVGNDPVILSGTPFLAYLTRVADMDPIAWLFAQFAACNMASVVLVSSNPTNLVLAGAYSLSFLTYTANTILPFLAAAVCVFPVLTFWTFPTPKYVPRIVNQPDVDPRVALIDKNGAIFGSVLLITALAVLVSTSAAGLHVSVWQVTVPAGLLMLSRDIAHDLHLSTLVRRLLLSKDDKVAALGHVEDPNGRYLDGMANEEQPIENSVEMVNIPRESQQSFASSSRTQSDATATPVHTANPMTLQSLISALEHRLPTLTAVVPRLPLTLLPFAFAMFTLVQGISVTGWLAVFTGWWATYAERTGPIGVVFLMGLVSVLLCNFCGTNIGATILLASILQSWTQQYNPSPRMSAGALYALAIGSNYGAFSTTFPASLAGLLWRTILYQKGIEVRTLQFAKLNLVTIAVAMASGCAVLIAQLYVVY